MLHSAIRRSRIGLTAAILAVLLPLSVEAAPRRPTAQPARAKLTAMIASLWDFFGAGEAPWRFLREPGRIPTSRIDSSLHTKDGIDIMPDGRK